MSGHKHEWAALEVLIFDEHVFVVQWCSCGDVRYVEAKERTV